MISIRDIYKRTRKAAIPLILPVLLTLFSTGCFFDQSRVEYNSYSIEEITPPVDRDSTTNDKKVYIGHSLPVNVTLTAEYDEDDVPLQVYLLNADDVNDVEEGIVYVDDIRMYYCYKTDFTNIEKLYAGTNTYGIVINVPADQSKDEYTDDFKVGTYYVLAQVDKNDEAEIDVYQVYEKFRDRLDDNNTVVVASDYASKPDLSVEDINFTGTEDQPTDSLAFYDLDLSSLPGATSANLGTMYLKPTTSGSSFTGSVTIKSSSSDTLNVPVIFYLAHDSWADADKIPLEIYDDDMGGFVEKYYIPILRKNTEETLNLQLRVPEDSGSINYFTSWDGSTSYTAWENESSKEDYPLFKLRYQMSKLTPETDEDGIKTYNFKIQAEVNPDGTVTESRFIKANNDNTAYTEDDYDETGDEYSKSSTSPVATKENNTLEENVVLSVETVNVKYNEGTQFYPCSATGDGSCDYNDGKRKFVIWWAGLGGNVGTNEFGAVLEAHAGMYFSNYSLLSYGFNAYVFMKDFIMHTDNLSVNCGYRLNLNAESHPFDSEKSFYEFVLYYGEGASIDWGDGDNNWWSGEASLAAFKSSATGFGEYELSSPITFSKMAISIDTEILGIGLNIKVSGGLQGFYILPRTKIKLNRDGSLEYNTGLSITNGIEAEVSVGAFDIIKAGVKGSIDLVSVDFGFNFFTRAYYNQTSNPGQVRGTLGIGSDITLTGPQGALSIYLTLPLFISSVTIERPILSFQAIKCTLLDTDFTESTKTNWQDVENANKIDYTVLEEDNN